MDMEQANIDNTSAFELLERWRTPAEHGLPIHLVIESRLAKTFQDAERVLELETAIRYHQDALTSGRTVCDQVLWSHLK